MLFVFYVLLAWLKIIVGITIIFLWLWIVRDRGAKGATLIAHAFGALLLWTAPWAAFVWTRVDLYRGKCGLRTGVHDCGIMEFVWSNQPWLRLGLILDILLLIGVFVVIFRSRLSENSNSGALGIR